MDAYSEELKSGFEFDGLYWHSEGVAKSTLNLYEKMKAFESVGIFVINIFEDEWINQRNKVIKLIKKSISKKSKIDIKNCEIRNITHEEKEGFFESNELIYSDNGEKQKAIIKNGKTIAVMSGSFSNNYKTLEITNFSENDKYGNSFSLLLKSFIKENNLIKNIFAEVDQRFINIKENVFLDNGFTLKCIKSPDYYFTKGTKRFTKEEFINLYSDTYKKCLNENDFLNKVNSRRIYDCGKAVFELIL